MKICDVHIKSWRGNMKDIKFSFLKKKKNSLYFPIVFKNQSKQFYLFSKNCFPFYFIFKN